MIIALLSLTESHQAEALLQVQKAAYRVEAELIGSDAIPALRETSADLQQCNEIFYGCWLESTLVGAISYQISKGTLDICRLVVHPSYFRQGIGRALLEFVERQIPGIERMIVSTGKENTPARQLYLRAGFEALHDEEVLPGLLITHFEKTLPDNAQLTA